MIRGVRGATTVKENRAEEIWEETGRVLKEMIAENHITADQVSHIWFTVTSDLDAAFPAKAAREISGWEFVPVMCAQEIPVPGSLERCIRVMMTADVNVPAKDVQHIFLNEAVALRPDLGLTKQKDS
ncbi:chorismate mutase [Marinococcus halotolerans]|uniref:chorismate mutase n=1 Tax=Marinococcus halotolerans TaxID=301092 RepID=UPI0003B686B3|nr:chorismate mutase [Marinococcus halotolerans]